jgi:hypothetical protein
MTQTTDGRRGRRARQLVIAIALGVAAVAVAALFWVRATYGVWSPLEAPTRFPMCDQRYTRLDGRPRTFDEAVDYDAQARDAIVLDATIGRLPVPIPSPWQFTPGAGYYGCGHLVLLRIEPDRYVLYYKLGGP